MTRPVTNGPSLDAEEMRDLGFGCPAQAKLSRYTGICFAVAARWALGSHCVARSHDRIAVPARKLPRRLSVVAKHVKLWIVARKTRWTGRRYQSRCHERPPRRPVGFGPSPTARRADGIALRRFLGALSPSTRPNGSGRQLAVSCRGAVRTRQPTTNWQLLTRLGWRSGRLTYQLRRRPVRGSNLSRGQSP